MWDRAHGRDGKAVGARRRGRRLAVLLALALLFATTGLAWAARAKVRVLRPSPSVCTGGTIKLGVRKRANPARYRIAVRSPSGSVIFSKRGKATRKLRSWRVRLNAEGVYRITYKTYRKTFRFRTDAVICQDESKVSLSIDQAAIASLDMENAAPGDRAEACVRVAYAGTLPAEVRMYGSSTGTGLDPYLLLTVTRGTLPPGEGGSCEGFVADPEDHIGFAPGVVYRGSLAGYPSDWATGVVDPTPGAPEEWTDAEERAYRMEVELQDDQAAQGLQT
ncbi:MAG TPA: hypothetical protein VGB28_02075, partial [Actinomycetota bacterium]